MKATRKEAPRYTQFSIFSILFIRTNKQPRSTRHWEKGFQHERKKPKHVRAKRDAWQTENVQETKFFLVFKILTVLLVKVQLIYDVL